MYPRMTFGRHKGVPLDRIPLSYLRWVLANCHNVSRELRRQIADVLEDGLPAGPPVPQGLEARLPSILRQWRRELSRQFHPDVSTYSVEVMQALNHAADRLEELIGI